MHSNPIQQSSFKIATIPLSPSSISKCFHSSNYDICWYFHRNVIGYLDTKTQLQGIPLIKVEGGNPTKPVCKTKPYFTFTFTISFLKKSSHRKQLDGQSARVRLLGNAMNLIGTQVLLLHIEILFISQYFNSPI